MKLFNRKKREDSPAFRRNMAKKINGMSVKYVTERRGGGEAGAETCDIF